VKALAIPSPGRHSHAISIQDDRVIQAQLHLALLAGPLPQDAQDRPGAAVPPAHLPGGGDSLSPQQSDVSAIRVVDASATFSGSGLPQTYVTSCYIYTYIC